MSTPRPQICLIGGSADHPSRILACLDVLQQHLTLLGGEAHIWDLARDPLPLLDPRIHKNPALYRSESVKKFAELAEQADAFIWGSPIYHDSFSGVLKNALDSLSIQQFSHKPVALISSGNNQRTGSQACDQLRIVARSLHAVVIPTQLVVLPVDFGRNQQRYFLVNEALEERFVQIAKEILFYAAALRSVRLSMQADSSHLLERGQQDGEECSPLYQEQVLSRHGETQGQIMV